MLEDPQSVNLVGESRGGGVVIAVGDADEKNNARSVERPHDLSADSYACVRSALENCPHRDSVPRRGALTGAA